MGLAWYPIFHDAELPAARPSNSGMRDEEEIQEGEGEVSPRPLLKKYQDPGLTGNQPKEKMPLLCLGNLMAKLVVTGPTMSQGAEARGSRGKRKHQLFPVATKASQSKQCKDWCQKKTLKSKREVARLQAHQQ